jgi:hypothetical protein
MVHNPFYGRQKIRLGDLRAVRREMVRCYHACVRRELDWQDFRAATLGLARIATIDQGTLLDDRVTALEQRLAELPKANGHDHHAAART